MGSEINFYIVLYVVANCYYKMEEEKLGRVNSVNKS